MFCCFRAFNHDEHLFHAPWGTPKVEVTSKRHTGNRSCGAKCFDVMGRLGTRRTGRNVVISLIRITQGTLPPKLGTIYERNNSTRGARACKGRNDEVWRASPERNLSVPEFQVYTKYCLRWLMMARSASRPTATPFNFQSSDVGTRFR